ncbi:hypothetical protein ACB087_10120 (plasmid) [Vibrio sp. VNB-15]
MKKTLLALAAVASLGMSVSASAASIGEANFQWIGTVPAPSVSESGYWIVTANGGELLQANNGVLKFDNKAGVIELIESQTFGFKVVTNAAEVANDKFDPATDKTSVGFKARLGALEVGKNGLPSSVDSSNYFSIQALNQATGANATLTTASDVTFAANQSAYISTVKNPTLTPAIAALGLDAEPNDVWQVVATVALTTTTL